MSAQQVTPEVLWAQRSSSTDAEKNNILLTLSVSDVPASEAKLDLKPNGLTFTGTSTTKNVTYHVELEFYAEIDPENSKIHHTARDVELVLRKKELKEEYWPRLLKDSKRQHFLKTNFDRWVDEDEQNAAPEDDDYMSKMNPAMGGDGGFGGIDFSKLGGAGGMPDLGDLGDMGGDMAGDDEGDDEDDDEMPALEDYNKAASAKDASTAKPKIEEV
ncbi:HSP20-like chaperone [Patellaria atrata CBS 101060]|uniref:HSP20-like chaperone n=1 Tax=Patellaria atrata CBS 101060 TaxID=1346257 RepID=A0A9P4SFW4_9PEZI|nr:HSP20-like chaperone [Patellaria atrata CBS 101060]